MYKRQGQGWDIWNLVSSLGGYLIALGIITLLYNLLSSLRRQPLLFEGDLMARILTPTESGNQVERILHSQGQ